MKDSKHDFFLNNGRLGLCFILVLLNSLLPSSALGLAIDNVKFLESVRSGVAVYAVSQRGSNATIFRIDSSTEQIINQQSIEGIATDIDIDEERRKLYCATWDGNAAEGKITQLDLDTLEPLQEFALPVFSGKSNAFQICALYRGYLMVTDYNDPDVSTTNGCLVALDTESGTILDWSIGSRGKFARADGRSFVYGESSTIYRKEFRYGEIVSVTLKSLYPFPSSETERAMVLSGDNNRIFWGNSVVNAFNLATLDATSSWTYATDYTGNLAFGRKSYRNLGSGSDHPLEPVTTIRAFNFWTEKLISADAGQLYFERFETGSSLFSPKVGAINESLTSLTWPSNDAANGYHLYLTKGDNFPDTPTTELDVSSYNFPTALEPGKYFWRIDTIMPFGILQGPVNNFWISPIQPESNRLKIRSLTKAPGASTSIEIVGGNSHEWNAESSQDWLTITPTYGTDSAEIEIHLNSNGLNPGNYDERITFRSMDGTTLFELSVDVVIDKLDVTEIISKPSSIYSYAISDDANFNRSYVIKINTAEERIEDSRHFDYSVSNLEISVFDETLYMFGEDSSTLLSLNYDTLEIENSFELPFESNSSFLPTESDRIVLDETSASIDEIHLVEISTGTVLDSAPITGLTDTRIIPSNGKLLVSNIGGRDPEVFLLDVTKDSLGFNPNDSLFYTIQESAFEVLPRSTLISDSEGERIFNYGRIFNLNGDLVWDTTSGRDQGLSFHAILENGAFVVSDLGTYETSTKNLVKGVPKNVSVNSVNEFTNLIITANEEELLFSETESLPAPNFLRSTPLPDGCKIEWKEQSLELSFEMEYRESGTNSWIAVDQELGMNLESTILYEMNGNQAYDLRLRSIIDGTSSEWSDSYRFETTTSNLARPDLIYDLGFKTLTGTVDDISLELYWTQVPDASGYRIEQKINDRDWQVIDFVPAEELSYSPSYLDFNTEYKYRVRAIGEEDVGPASNRVDAYPKTSSTAEEPTGLFATVQSFDSIRLNWDISLNEVFFNILMLDENGDWVQIAQVPANTTSYLHSGLETGRLYTYSVAAVGRNNSVPRQSVRDFETPRELRAERDGDSALVDFVALTNTSFGEVTLKLGSGTTGKETIEYFGKLGVTLSFNSKTLIPEGLRIENGFLESSDYTLSSTGAIYSIEDQESFPGEFRYGGKIRASFDSTNQDLAVSNAKFDGNLVPMTAFYGQFWSNFRPFPKGEIEYEQISLSYIDFDKNPIATDLGGNGSIAIERISSDRLSSRFRATISVKIDEAITETIGGTTTSFEFEEDGLITFFGEFTLPSEFGYWAQFGGYNAESLGDRNEFGIPLILNFALARDPGHSQLELKPVHSENGIELRLDLPAEGLNAKLIPLYSETLDNAEWEVLPEEFHLDGIDSFDVGSSGMHRILFPDSPKGFIKFKVDLP